jgi:hypothetical protein
MTTYYVATLAKYVLVEAENEAKARELGRVGGSRSFTPKRGRRIGKEVPVKILVVRPATTDEIEFCRCSEEMLARERAMNVG